MVTIQLGGKLRPVFFGFFAFKVFEDETGIPFSKMGESLQNMTVETLTAFIYAGLMSGYKRDKLQVDFVRDDIYDWLDEYDQGIDHLVTVFANSMPNAVAGKNVKAPKKK